MAKSRKVMIPCAVTGSIHTPTVTPSLPVTPQEIADAAVAAAEAGAAVLRLHARDPVDGRPSAEPALFMEFVRQIGARTEAVLDITAGGSSDMTLQVRGLSPAAAVVSR